MPTNRRRRAQARRASVHQRNEWVDFYFLFMMKGDVFNVFGDDREAQAEYWSEFGEEITAEWIAKSPGTRPAAWWVFTHGESRPIVNPMDPRWEPRWIEENTTFGVLHADVLHGWPPGHPDGEMDLRPWLEPQDDYLDRHGLLTAEERAALGRPARKPSRPRRRDGGAARGPGG